MRNIRKLLQPDIKSIQKLTEKGKDYNHMVPHGRMLRALYEMK
jgi:hypothetical protein